MCGSCGKGTTTRGGFRKIKKGDKLKALTYEQLKAKISSSLL